MDKPVAGPNLVTPANLDAVVTLKGRRNYFLIGFGRDVLDRIDAVAVGEKADTVWRHGETCTRIASATV